MKNKNLLNTLKDSSAEIYQNLRTAGTDFWVSMGGLAILCYGLYDGNGKIIFASLPILGVAGFHKLYNDFFSSKREPVPEALKPRKKALEYDVHQD
jgi:hypothetical protein